MNLELFDSLVVSFKTDISDAHSIQTSTPAKLETKLAIVGFKKSIGSDFWRLKHLQFLESWLDEEYSSEELEHYGNNGSNIRLFAAVAVGYLLGLFESYSIDEKEFNEGLIMISGSVMLHLGSLTSEAVV